MREYFKRWPWLYYTIVDVFGPIYFGGVSPKRFIDTYYDGGRSLNLGAGARLLDSRLEHIDAYPYPVVSLVADITNIPIESSSVSLIVCDNVLEHVVDPIKALNEIHRLLKQGGVGYLAVPFLYPFHSSPDDYQRWTKKGLLHYCRDFEIVECGVRSGPFSVLTVYLVYMSALLLSFGSKRLYDFLINAFIFVYFPIKYLDFFANKLPFTDDLAADFFIIIKKK